MSRHTYKFEGGNYLTTMSATWFVSYFYYEHIDTDHTNWQNVGTTSTRLTAYKNSTQYHYNYLEEVLKILLKYAVQKLKKWLNNY